MTSPNEVGAAIDRIREAIDAASTRSPEAIAADRVALVRRRSSAFARRSSTATWWRLPELSGARVLVTGATGLIGTNLVQRLVALGSEVGAVVRPAAERRLGPGITVLTADLRDAPAHGDRRPRLPAHVHRLRGDADRPCPHRRRAPSGARGRAGRDALLLDLAVETGVRRFVQVGSSLEYGPRDRPLREDDPLEPTTFRGAVKAAASVLCLQRARAGDLSAVVVRPFSVYGPAERDGRLVPTALRAALEGSSLALTAEDSVHDFVFVDDVVDGIVAALTGDEDLSGRAINLGTGIQTANSELVRLVERVTGRPVAVATVPFPPRPSDTHRWVADPSLAQAVLGWTPRTDLASGLDATARRLQERRSVSATTPELSVVVPVYRNRQSLAALAARVRAALAPVCSYELVLVDDACPDGSGELIEELAASDQAIVPLYLPANRGQHRAVLAGLAVASGSYCVIMDADLQDPPEELPVLLDRASAGDVDAVFAGRAGRYESGGGCSRGGPTGGCSPHCSRFPATAASSCFCRATRSIGCSLCAALRPPSWR